MAKLEDGFVSRIEFRTDKPVQLWEHDVVAELPLPITNGADMLEFLCKEFGVPKAVLMGQSATLSVNDGPPLPEPDCVVTE